MGTGFDSGSSESRRSSKSDQARFAALFAFFFFLLLNATHMKSPTPIDPSLHSPLFIFSPTPFLLLLLFSVPVPFPLFCCGFVFTEVVEGELPGSCRASAEGLLHGRKDNTVGQEHSC